MAATLSRARMVGVLLLTVLTPSALVGQSSTPDPWREFPSYDVLIAMRLREGADAQEAERLLAQAPASVDTFTKLVRAKRLDDALVVLKRALDAADAAQTIAALRALNNTITSFQFDQARSYHDTIRNLVEPVRARVATLPREDAARLAWELFYLDRMWDRRGGQVLQFIHDYGGTEAALLAQVDLLTSNPGQILKEIADLDQFARDHPRTNAGAKALFQEGFELHVNIPGMGIEPRGSDPTERLLRVAAIVNELESGSFPPSEWVDKAPSLMTGFFVSDTPPPGYSPENLDRAIDIYTDFVRTHLRLSGALDLDNSIGYVIVSKLGDLFARKGDRVGGIERTLDDLEKAAPDPGAVQLLRAQYYARQSTAGPEADRAMMAVKAETVLAKLASANLGASSRRALAFEAVSHYYRRDYVRALPKYQEYLNRYPSSSWAPIAALRIGECYEQGKDWPKAAAAYARAAAKYSSEPYARVLGGASASRALEAQRRFEDALAAATQALNGWDTHYGIEYTILSYQTEAPSVGSGAVVNQLRVTRDDLTARVATLDGDLRQRGGQLLARGRWELDQRQFNEAVSTLTSFLQQEPRSPVLADARSLLHRAQLELALDLASAESPHYDKAKAAAALDAIAKEPFDAVVATATLAKALLMATEGRDGDAEALMARTLDSWVASQHDLTAQPPAEGIDADIAEIRQVVFRPLGDLPVYAGHFRFPAVLPRLIVVSPDVQVKTSDGQVRRHTVYQTFPDLDHVLFLTSDEVRLLARLLPTIGGTGRRAPARDTQTPNQPSGTSVNIRSFWTRFFPAHGQTLGWEFDTYPTVTQIEFVDAERTKANVSVVLGYEGATVVLEKTDGQWRAVRLVNQWES